MSDATKENPSPSEQVYAAWLRDKINEVLASPDAGASAIPYQATDASGAVIPDMIGWTITIKGIVKEANPERLLGILSPR